MPQYPDSKFTEIEGVDFIRDVARKAKTIFRTFDGGDTGIDALIEFRSGVEASGDLIALQIKSGPSYWSQDYSQCRVPIKPKWLAYWRDYSLPVILVVFDRNQDRAAWVDVQLYVMEHPEIIVAPKAKFSFAADKWFDINTVQQDLRLIAGRMDRFGRISNWSVTRAEAALQRLLSMATRLYAEGYESGTEALKQRPDEFWRIRLPFDGNITCLDTRGICTFHHDERLLGKILGNFSDTTGRYVFRNLLRTGIGYRTWIDDFDPEAFKHNESIKSYLSAGKGRPIRVNYAIYSFFAPWKWFLIVEVHSKLVNSM